MGVSKTYRRLSAKHIDQATGNRARFSGVRALLWWSLLISLVLHFSLACIFWLLSQPRAGTESATEAAAQAARIKPEEVVNVELWGEVPSSSNLEPPMAPPPPTPAPQTQTKVAEAPPPEAETGGGVPPDVIALGPKAETKPPEVAKKRGSLPRVTPPKVKPAVKPRPSAPAPKSYPRPALTGPGLNSSPMKLIGSPEATKKDLAVTEYFNRFLREVQRRWSPRGMGLGGSPQVWYRIVIDPGGNVISVRIMRASGNPYFDRSVEVAIRGVSSLPPLPRSFGGQNAVSDFGFRLNQRR